MPSTDRTPEEPGTGTRGQGRLAAVTGLVSVIGAVVLGFTGHPEAAAAVGVAGGAVAGGIHVTVNIDRRPPGRE
ncbi:MULTISPECIES: hypothetical protein [unclassified Streptomyces]|uniref:hypothetical protein n=1 Tax=unclassified Streptomyces TaxID=2593676 RepID=UPI000939B5AF|nr:hypothetical protein [Streptomyces sp. CB02058]OKI93769.1 hypothetical protein AMK10_15405 [Streptomyces sp. CB02058]